MMLVLGIDTSGRGGSLALVQCEPGAEPQRLAGCELAGREYSSTLLPLLDSALKTLGRTVADVGVIAVASGPGSFTGLRIGLATAKGVAEALAIPLVAISVLEALALANAADGMVIAALDAQRKEVYWGELVLQNGKIVRSGEQQLVSRANFVAMLAARGEAATVFTPDATMQELLGEAGLPVRLVERPSAEVYARLGAKRFAAGETTSSELLEANYIRRSDAEIFVAPKLGIHVN